MCWLTDIGFTSGCDSWFGHHPVLGITITVIAFIAYAALTGDSLIDDLND